ncbi:hypothetical protein GE21DRAFT_1065888 [Neurospora crassa]|nr:hypothetical protein GE21DRAFT_1065888 [Neurospora crassa]
MTAFLVWLCGFSGTLALLGLGFVYILVQPLLDEIPRDKRSVGCVYRFVIFKDSGFFDSGVFFPFFYVPFFCPYHLFFLVAR